MKGCIFNLFGAECNIKGLGQVLNYRKLSMTLLEFISILDHVLYFLVLPLISPCLKALFDLLGTHTRYIQIRLGRQE